MKTILGVGGGIAAYKAAELCRQLVQRDAAVQVVMTRGAQEFVQPLTFAALTGRKVITSLFSSASSEDTLSSAIEHIAVAQDNERDCGVFSILLVSDPLVRSQDGVEAGVFRGFEKRPIAQACPSLVSGSSDVMAANQQPELVRQIFI